MSEEIVEREKVADAVLDKVKHYTIGFAGAGETPAAKGSGVLIKYGEWHGILTCTHVDKYLRDLKRPGGIVRLNRGLAQQSATLEMEEVFSYAAAEEPWEGDAADASDRRADVLFLGRGLHAQQRVRELSVSMLVGCLMTCRDCSLQRPITADPGPPAIRS
jgi:hypothetical protein